MRLQGSCKHMWVHETWGGDGVGCGGVGNEGSLLVCFQFVSAHWLSLPAIMASDFCLVLFQRLALDLAYSFLSFCSEVSACVLACARGVEWEVCVYAFVLVHSCWFVFSSFFVSDAALCLQTKRKTVAALTRNRIRSWNGICTMPV